MKTHSPFILLTRAEKELLELQFFKLQKSFSSTPEVWHPRTPLKNGFLLLWLLTDLDCSCPWCFVCVFSLSLASETRLDRAERRLIWPLHTAFSPSPCSLSLWVTFSVCFKSLSICSGRQHPIIYSKFVLNWAHMFVHFKVHLAASESAYIHPCLCSFSVTWKRFISILITE